MRVRFGYTGRGGEMTDRDVEPYRLVATGRRWYLLAWDGRREDWRTFRLDRMAGVRASTFRFRPRPAPDAVEHVRRAVTRAGYAHRVRVRLTADVEAVRRRVPAAYGVATQVRPGVTDLESSADDLASLARHLTMAAFDLAMDLRSDLVETDVQRTKDGVLVLVHDTDLKRTTNIEQRYPGRRSYAVKDTTWAEIKTLDAGSWKAAKYRGERIPTLSSLVRRVKERRSGLLLELKSPSLYPGIEQQIDRIFRASGFVSYGRATGKVQVQSFDFTSMKRYHAIDPWMPVGLLGRPYRWELDDLTWADQVNPNYLASDATYVRDLHAQGFVSYTWTVNDEIGMNMVLDRGHDGIITNRPDLAHSVLLTRG